MSYLQDDFPNTHYYEQDLGWLLRHVQDLITKYADIESRVSSLEELYSTIPNEIQKAVNAAMAEIRAEMDAYFQKMDALVLEIKTTQAEIQNQITDILNTITKINALIEKVKQYCMTYADYKDTLLEQKIMDYLNGIIKEWPLVRCPVDGNMENINIALEHMWSQSGNGVRVKDLIDWNVTVQDLIDNGITVNDLIWNRFKLYSIFVLKYQFYMVSPITGVYEDARQVIRELAALHELGPSVQELIDEEITVDELINNDISVYQMAYSNTWLNDILSNRVTEETT